MPSAQRRRTSSAWRTTALIHSRAPPRAVAILWGLNVLAIHLSLEQFPPFFLGALRFALLAVPTILLVPRPDVPLHWLIGDGVGLGTLHFLFLHWALATGMPARCSPRSARHRHRAARARRLTYTVLLGTVVGSGLWTWLLSRHPAARVAPFSMLVPVVGLLTAWVALGETLTAVEIAAAGIVGLGVLLGSGALPAIRRAPSPTRRPAAGAEAEARVDAPRP